MAAVATTFKKVTRVRRGDVVVIIGEPHVVVGRWVEKSTGAMFLRAKKDKKFAREFTFKFPQNARVMLVA